MKRSLFILLLLACSTLTALPHEPSEREKDGFRGKVRTVENYETVFSGPENNRESSGRYLRGLSIYNKKGDLLERWELTNDLTGSYYQRQVYAYNAHHKKENGMIYKSEKGEREVYFSAVRSASASITILPALKENLFRKIAYRYNSDGKLAEETSTDSDDTLIERRISAFDTAGNLIKFSVVKGDGTVEYESLELFFDKGRISESTSIYNNSETQRYITFKDRNGTVEKSENYVYKSVDGSNDRKRFVLTNTMGYTYLSDRVNLEWRFFKPNGQTESKLVIVQQHDLEVSRVEYKAGDLPPGSQNENIVPVWIAGESIFHKHVFDDRGNLIRHDWLEQKSPESPILQMNIFENVISYFD